MLSGKGEKRNARRQWSALSRLPEVGGEADFVSGEGDALKLKPPHLLIRSSKGVARGKSPVCEDHPVAGSIWVRICVERVANSAAVAGTQKFGNLAVGRYFSGGNFSDDLIDAVKKTIFHCVPRRGLVPPECGFRSDYPSEFKTRHMVLYLRTTSNHF